MVKEFSTALKSSADTIRLLALFALCTALLSGCAAGTSTAKAARPVTSGIKGVVTEPVEGAYIYIYEKGADPYGPPYAMTQATGADGSFEMGVPDGEYTLVARKHKSGQPGSPLSPDDQKTEPVNITVKGGVVNQPLSMFKKTDDIKYFDASAASDTAIQGRITDSDGNPMKGFRVHVYTYAQMSERPKYVSAASGADGRFIVFLPKGGTYYLAARDNFGAPPKIGDYFGRYDEGTIDPSGVIVRTGQKLEHIDITVHKVW